MSDAAKRTLNTSNNPDTLMAAGRELARSALPDEQQALLAALSSAKFLGMLDSPEEYAETRYQIRLGRITTLLKMNATPAAWNTLTVLTQTDVFLDNERRVDLLIDACAAIRPPTPPVLKFWEARSQPEDSFTMLTVEAVVENGASAALAILERCILNPAHEFDAKIAWMRTSILRHRDDVHLLETCERLVKNNALALELKVALLEVLYDYRGDEWYAPERRYPKPPDRQKAAPEARALLRRIAEHALAALQLPPELTAVIKSTLEWLRQVGTGRP